jgi:hypothetical protein
VERKEQGQWNRRDAYLLQDDLDQMMVDSQASRGRG